MRLHLCGVRGSTPAPGPAFTRVGGHTSCVAIAHDGEWRPRLLLDGGTGLRRVAELLGDAPFEGVLLLGHLHWDHTQGIPFFGAGDRPDARVDVHLPGRRRRCRPCPRRDDVTTVLPHRCRRLAGTLVVPCPRRGAARGRGVHRARQGDPAHRRAHVRVPRQRRRRRRWPTCPTTVRSPSAVARTAGGRTTTRCCALADGVDVLLHDAQFTPAELAARPHFGHSAVDYAVALAEHCNVGRLLLYHHDPERTDDEVDALVDQHRGAR